MDLSLRPLRHSDIAAGLRLCRACHWNQLEEDWRCFLDLSGGGYVAWRGETVVGTAAFLRFGAFSWVAMMLVDPEARRGGVASRLMEAALQELREVPVIRLDATPQGEPLYRRYGFRDEYPLVRTKVAVREQNFRGSRVNARPMDSADLAPVFARDRLVFGADRSELLASFYRRAPQLAWIAPEAYCFGRPGHLYSQIGPLVAPDVETAAGLVARCLSSQRGGQFAMDVPGHSPQWIAWLESEGFAIERPFLRMRRGDGRPLGLADRQFAIAGPEFG